MAAVDSQECASVIVAETHAAFLVIKASSSTRVNALIADLGSERAAVREAAVAGLIVLGARTVERLGALAADAGAQSVTRIAVLRALEAIDDPRGLDVALQLLDDKDLGVASGAIGVARVFLRGPRGVVAVDRLTSVALDRRRPEPIRAAAIRALGDLHASTLRPIVEALRNDPSRSIRALVTTRRAAARRSERVKGLLHQAVAGVLPDEPAALRSALGLDAGDLSLSDISGLIELIRERERTAPSARQVEWLALRAAAHAVLAHRGSRLALYDLRETLEAADAPLPVEFAAALVAVGDSSCLESIAAAHARRIASGARGEDWWIRHLIDAFRAIVARERLTKRHAVLKKIEKRWPDASRELWGGGPERAALRERALRERALRERT
jgi:HEAT repeat protein